MKNNESELTAYCGLFCGDCIRYQCKASDLSESLLDEIKKSHWLQYAAVKTEGPQTFSSPSEWHPNNRPSHIHRPQGDRENRP
jgi:hypothetical protein